MNRYSRTSELGSPEPNWRSDVFFFLLVAMLMAAMFAIAAIPFFN